MKSSNTGGLAGLFFFSAALCVGCYSPGEESDEPLGVEREPVTYGWSAPYSTSMLLGVARAPCTSSNPDARAHAWFANGRVCRGKDWWTGGNLCEFSDESYIKPTNVGAIVGVSIAHNTSRVYAWYTESPDFPGGSVSQGARRHLNQYAGPMDFVRPANPRGGLFTMGQLIDADHSDNGKVYYYWREGPNFPVYRTTGTTDNASSHTIATEVPRVASNRGAIMGISFGDWLHAGQPDYCHSAVGNRPVETWYQDGFVNISNSSLNLNDPDPPR